MAFIDIIKRGLGIDNAQKALQWVGQNAPRQVIDPIIQSEQILKNPPMLSIPRIEMPKYLPSTVQWFGNTAANIPSMAVESAVNIPSLLTKGVMNTGEALADQVQRGERVPLTRYAKSIAPFAEGILNLGTLGIGGGVAKAGIESVAKPVLKSTFRSLVSNILKGGAKMAVEGAGIGAGYGALGGIQSTETDDVNEMIDRALSGAKEGAVAGAVVAPVVGGALKLGGKVFGKGKKQYDAMTPQERQAGFVKPSDIVPKSVQDLLARTKKTLEKKTYPVEKPAIPYEPTGKVNLPEGTKKVVDSIHRALSKQGEKTFDKSKTTPALEYYARNLGDKEMLRSYTETLKYPKEKSITRFWENLRQRAREKGIADFDEWQQAVANRNEPEGFTTPQKTVSTLLKPKQEAPVVKPMELTPSKVTTEAPVMEIQPTKERLASRMKQIKDTTPDLPAARSKAEAFINAKLKPFYDEINNKNLDPEVVYKVADKQMEAPNADYKRVAEGIRDFYTGEGYEFISSFGGKVGQIEGLPRVWESEIAQVADTFATGNDILDPTFKNLHRMNRTGKGEGYINDPITSVKTALLSGAEEYLKPENPMAKEIAEHVAKLEDNKPIDYVEKVNPVPLSERPKVDLKLLPGEKTASFPERMFRRIGGEIREAFTILRDSRDLMPRRADELFELAKKRDVRGSIDYLAEIAGLTKGSEKYNAFETKAAEKARQMGLDRFNQQMLRYISGDYPMKKLVEKIGKYDYADPRVKQFLNEFIDAHLKGEHAKKTIIDNIADGVRRVFSASQIMGNIKVALQQGTEITRIPATTLSNKGGRAQGMVALLKGAKDSMFRRKELDRLYGFGNKELDYTQRITGKIEKVGYGPLIAMENWKNSVFVGAGEYLGKAQGLTGNKLATFVRDYVYRYGHIADKYMTPEILQKSGLSRLLLQYSQFQMKNTLGKVDNIMAKQYAEGLGMILSDVLNATIITLGVGSAGKYAFDNLSNLLAPIGIGPVVTFARDIYDITRDYIDDEFGSDTYKKENAGNVAKTRITGLLTRNVVPFGAQFSKTSGAIRDIVKGYGETMAGNIKYIPSDNPVESIQAMLFGTNAFKGAQEYNKGYQKGEATGIGGNFRKLIIEQMNRGDKDQARKTLEYARAGQKARGQEKKTMTADEKAIDTYLTSQIGDKSIAQKKETYQIKWQNPEILARDTRIAIKQAEETGEPVRPFFQLSPEQQRTIMRINSLPYGDEAKKQLNDENKSWIQPYYKLENAYWDEMQNKGLSLENPEAEAKRPSDEVQKKLDYYNTLPYGTGARTAYANANPDLKAYWAQVRERGNEERKALGLPPLPEYGSGGSSSKKLENFLKYDKYKWSNLKAKNKARITKGIKSILKKPPKQKKTSTAPIKVPKFTQRKSIRAMLVKKPKYPTFSYKFAGKTVS